MTIVINGMVVALSGGSRASKNNLRPGQSLGFIEMIHSNAIFGEAIYPDLFHQAGAYMYYIIKNHSFHDGNKRTGLAAAVSFLQWNGVELHPFEEDRIFDFVEALAGTKESPEEAIPRIARWFETLSDEQDSHRLL